MGHAEQLSTARAGHDHGSRCYHAGSDGIATARVSTYLPNYTIELVGRLRLIFNMFCMLHGQHCVTTIV